MPCRLRLRTVAWDPYWGHSRSWPAGYPRHAERAFSASRRVQSEARVFLRRVRRLRHL